ncbi:hypothetical protein FJ366_03055 [Candidatus Dependentiae bacterium]|nr:hypothetical protein [Candidatus Dependentiae bacterium]
MKLCNFFIIVIFCSLSSYLSAPKKEKKGPFIKPTITALPKSKKKLDAARTYAATHSDEDSFDSLHGDDGKHLPSITYGSGASSTSSTSLSRTSSKYSIRPGVETTFTRKERKAALKAEKERAARLLTRKAKTLFDEIEDDETTLEDFLASPKRDSRRIAEMSDEMRADIAAAKIMQKDRDRLNALTIKKIAEEQIRAKAAAAALVERRARVTGRIEAGTERALEASELFSPRSREELLGKAQLARIQHHIRVEEARARKMGSISDDSDGSDE